MLCPGSVVLLLHARYVIFNRYNILCVDSRDPWSKVINYAISKCMHSSRSASVDGKSVVFFVFFLEPLWQGGSNKYPQSMFRTEVRKNNVYTCKPQFYYIKVGFKGIKIIQACFRDAKTDGSFTAIAQNKKQIFRKSFGTFSYSWKYMFCVIIRTASWGDSN